MRGQWEGVREALVQSIVTLESDLLFREFRRTRRPFASFGSPSELVHYLASACGNLDEKDIIYAALVVQVQDRGRDSDLAFAIAMLGLWPRLDWVYRRNLRFFPAAPDELAGELCSLFTAGVASADLRRISRIAATLVLNVNRDLRRRLRRSWDEDRRRADLPDDAELEGRTVHREWRDSPLVVLPNVSDEAQIASVRTRLRRVVGDDADLLIDVAIVGFNTRELADRAGRNHETVRKRYTRAVQKVRRVMSHSTRQNGVSPTGPRGPRRRAR